jgi:hypothetical protein
MPRKGPKKTTSRDSRNEEKQNLQAAKISEEKLIENENIILAKFDSDSRPKMPDAKCDQKSLRRALKKKGLELENWVNPDSCSKTFTFVSPSDLVGYSRQRLFNVNESDDDNDND